MAFIREYAEMSGDPFRFRLPKALRKAAKGIGRAAKKIGRVALPVASLVPGLGIGASLVGKLASRAGKIGGLTRAARKGVRYVRQVTTPDVLPVAEEETISEVPNIAQEISPELAEEPADEVLQDEEPAEEPAPEEDNQVDYEAALQYARAYGFQGDPAPSRRKAAAAGPRAKAASKKQARAVKATGMKATGPQKRRNKGKGQSLIMGPNPKLNLHALAVQAAGALGQQGIASALTKAHARDFGGAARGGKHRRVNPLNVKALKRAARRFEGFEKQVKHVRKSMRGFASVLAPAHRSSGSTMRGHKRGCRCVACRAA